ncbi:SEL1-like repeat protein [Aeromonas sp. MR19]|uniref:tetratricopeptide repeat protein n=1 Tax=Aeromonas sp. MR19 TaxID=2923421 RepID=UPI001F4B5613|nr:SEL1-like repeat protein [Aeromonas sp. MR19]MCH7373904.1 SEL1-like repeat protein [Aeromonas sp. MR19]
MNKSILALLLGWTCLWTNIVQAKDLANKPIAVIEQYASLGDVDAQIFLSKLYYEEKNYKLAETWLRAAAEQGIVRAQVALAVFYYHGIAVPPDYRESAFWARKAAIQGDSSAQEALGILYFEGKGVTQNYQQAEAWARKAAEQGNAGAQFLLGRLYYQGKGVHQNYKLAYVWFSVSATNGEPSSVELRDNSAKHLTNEVLIDAQVLAEEYFHKYKLNK